MRIARIFWSGGAGAGNWRLGRLPGVLLAGLVVAGGGGLPGCGSKEMSGPLTVYTGPLMETTNVRTLFSDSARLKLILTAPLEQNFENGDAIYPQGMKVAFFGRDGQTVINTLTANYGKVDKGKNLYIMRGRVEAANVPNQQVMKTEELFMDRNKQQIYTVPTMAVEVVTPAERLTGFGLTANEDFSRYRITQPTGVFSVSDPVR